MVKISKNSEIASPASNKTLFTVICTVFNHENYIWECIESILLQDFSDFQLIIIDDGSTDSSLQIAKGALSRYEPQIVSKRIAIKVIESPNSGQSIAFEIALRLADGEFIALIDSDDIWNPDKLVAISEIIRNSTKDTSLFMHRVEVIDEIGRLTGSIRPLGAKLSDGDLRKQVLKDARVVSPATSGLVIRKSVCDALMPSPLVGHSGALDAYLVLGAAKLGTIRSTNRVLAKYRIHRNGQYLRRLQTVEGIARQLDIQEKIVSKLNIKDSAKKRNSFYARNYLVYSKLAGKGILKDLFNLVIAINTDKSFSVKNKILMSVFWVIFSISSSKQAKKLWALFLNKQVGLRDRVIRRYMSPVINSKVDFTTYSDTASRAIFLSSQQRNSRMHAANVHMIMEAYDDPAFQEVVNSADINTPDGMPLVWALKLLGHPEATRVYGPTLMLHVCEAAAREGIPIGLYGGTDESLLAFREFLHFNYPGIRIAYSYAPPFRPLTEEEDAAVVRDILASGARILFVGIGCPKQEWWMYNHRQQLPLVMLGVGAAFDFHTGRVRQAPAALQGLGLEWLFRLVMEPRRLWKRYAKHNPRFVWLFGQQLFRERVLGKKRRELK